MKIPTWAPAFVISLGLHLGLAMVAVPIVMSQYSERMQKSFSGQAQNTVFAFAIGWCVVAAAWSASVTRTLSNETNRWGGIHGLKLFGLVAGGTLLLDLVNGPCLWTCPPIALVVPILSAFAIMNNSAPVEDDGPTAVG